MITFPGGWARRVWLGGLSWCFSSSTVMRWLRLELIEGSTGLDIQVGFVSHLTDFSAEVIWTRAGNWLVNLSPPFFPPSGVPFFVWPIQMAIWGFLTPCPSQNEWASYIGSSFTQSKCSKGPRQTLSAFHKLTSDIMEHRFHCLLFSEQGPL